MNSLKLKIKSSCYTLMGLALLSTPAFAATGETYGTASQYRYVNAFSLGNSNAGGKVYSRGRSASTHTGRTAKQKGEGTVGAEARFLGARFVVMSADAINDASHTGGTNTSWKLSSCVKFMGVTTTCKKSNRTNSNYTMDTGSKTYSKKFFSASARFMVGPIPVKVSGSVKGYVRAQAKSKAYQGSISGATLDRGDVYASMSAGATGYGETVVGLKKVVAVGATAQVKVIDGTIYSDDEFARYNYANRPNSSKYRYTGNIKGATTYSVGKGNLKVWAKLWPFGKASKTVASWGDFIARSKTLYNVSYAEYFAHASGTTTPPPAQCGKVYSSSVLASQLSSVMPRFISYCGSCGIYSPNMNSNGTYRLQCSK